MNECRLGRGHGPVFDEDFGYFCPGCGEMFSPDEVRERLAERARECGLEGSEAIMVDGHVVMAADPDAIDLSEDPEILEAFMAAMNAPATAAPVRWHYLAWSCCPGRDWAEPPSLACRGRAAVRHCLESARFRRLRACMRAHPSDGPPATSASIGSVPVVFP